MGTEINHVVGVWCVNNFRTEEYALFSLIPSLHVKYTDIGFIVLKTNIRVFFLANPCFNGRCSLRGKIVRPCM